MLIVVFAESFYSFSEYNDKEKNVNKLQKLLKVQPETILLPPDITQTIFITFSPINDMVFKKVPVFICHFTDYSLNEENFVKSSEIFISGKVLTSKYRVCPDSELHFGQLRIGEIKKITITLENIGMFEFKYNIIDLNKQQERLNKTKKVVSATNGKKSVESSMKSNKSLTKSTKTKDSVQKSTVLVVGPFSLVSSSGTLKANESCTIIVEALVKELTEYKENILIEVSESNSKGQQLNLTVIGAEPQLNFSDFYKIFQEQYVINNINELNFAENINLPIFTIDDNTLNFNNVCLNTTEETKIYLENISGVEGKISLILNDISDDLPVFSVFPNSFYIKAYDSQSFTLQFQPKAIQVITICYLIYLI